MRKLMTQFAIVMLAAATAMLFIETRFASPLRVGSSSASRKLQREVPGSDARSASDAPTPEHPSRGFEDQDVAAADELGSSAPGLTDTPSESDAKARSRRLHDDEEYGELYGTMSQLEMKAECEQLSEKVMHSLAEQAGAMMSAGRYEVVGYGNMVPQVVEDRTKLVAYQLVSVPESPEREIRKIELLEADYPDMYELHRKAMWLSDKLQDRSKSGVD